jgi:hypothetical protein
MSSAKKKTPSKTARKLKDLKSKKDPRGGNVASNTLTKVTPPPPKPKSSGWIEIESFSFGSGNP